MKLRTVFLIIALLVVAISVADEVKLSRSIDSRRTLKQQADEAAERAGQRIAELSATLGALEEKQATLTAAFRPAKKAPPNEELKPQISRFQQRLDKDPRLQVLKRNARHATINASHASLFRKLGLTEEDQETFKKLILDYEQDKEDLFASMREKGAPNMDPTVGKLVAQIETEFSKNLRALLGDDKLAQYKDYERSTLIRDMVAGIGGAATTAGTPIPTDHLETLVRIMSNSSPTYQKGGIAGPWDVDFEVVDAQARVILSPAQYEIFTRSNAQGPNLGNDRSGAELNQAIQKIIAQEAVQSRVRRPES